MRRFVGAAPAALALALVVTGPGAGVRAAAARTPAPTRLAVSFDAPLGGSQPRSWVVTRAGQVRAVLAALRALPARPSATMYCPSDFDARYTLRFWAGSRPVAAASLDPAGCQFGRWQGLPGGRVRAVWAPSGLPAERGFWALLARALGVRHRGLPTGGRTGPG